MSSQWDHGADKDLLLAIIDDGQLKSIKWQGIMLKMQDKGYSFSHEACRQHFQKIRKESKSGSGPPSHSTSKDVSTPTKKKNGNHTPGTANSKRKSTSKTSYFLDPVGGGDDDETFNATPSKKRRMVKEEIEQENDYGHQLAPAFKAEKDPNHIDLSNESPYDDSGAEDTFGGAYA